ncbi:mandelate racemase/muconate lactonizing enzyme family protein [Lignipirellula cremea]|uniref:D-galactonate dehydratase n=1 Tax=Lignipirellula cremea TaxID=2528010 RepID=A0A518DYZ8_9BACT|nr:mandelate racemase/muconate lactonizing enzyme family protein [Lignipirellula cremea]QDU97070.1 D-galactonate dehydratase [Lignipirellula cremea]
MSKIVAVETIIPDDIMSNLLLLRIHTDDGLIGHGETYYTPHAIAALVHDWMAERLLGGDALAIESHWRFLYDRCSAFGQPGAELRALSAIDVALWDILGQACGQPVYRLLGGPVRPSIPVYNTCGGPTYGAGESRVAKHPGWPGYGDVGQAGPLQDNWSSLHAAGDLAEELVAEGFYGMKLWPFDRFAHATGGTYLSWDAIDEGMRPLREIRDRVGMQIEIIIEGHAFFQLPAALRMAEALREVRPLWLEDVLRVDNIATLADFRRQSGMPIAASEMLLARRDFLELLQAGAADYVMVDPTWCGGLSESMRVIRLAEGYNIPVTIHDCTGPFTLLSGLHLAASAANVAFQEVVRAHIRTFYERLIDPLPIVERGQAQLPTQPGIGARLHPELFQPGKFSYRRSAR